MIKFDRQQKIMEYLQSHGSLRVSEAVKSLNASQATIRRDFDELCEDGKVQRSHGGIVLTQNKIKGWMPPYQWRRTVQSAEKERIGERAATMVGQGDAIFIDGGSTTLHMAPYLPPRVKVITNSVILASAIDEMTSVERPLEVYLSGGFLYPQSGLLVGSQAVETLSKYHTRLSFISVGGITAQGLTNNIDQVVDAEKAMMENADEVIILADYTKIGRTAMVEMGSLSEINMLITNKNADPQEIEAIQTSGVEVEMV